MRLAGKVALLTGAAAARPGQLMGFGGASAHLFVREGAKVVISDILDDLGEQAASEMRETGADVRYLHLDVTSEADWSQVIETILSDLGRLDVLVNNAGTVVMKKVEDLSEADWDLELSVHAKGMFLGTKHAIPAMRESGGGSIINISSVMGIVGSPTSPAYAAAKGAIRLFTKSTALQYATENIRVNSVHPGYARTPLNPLESTALETVLGKTPMGRLGTAEEIANGILFLASDESSYMTGSELVIDGGMTAQ